MTNNLKPFDLQAALKGEPVMLRDGRKAFVRHHETEQLTGSCWQIWGISNSIDGSTMFVQWSTDGRYDMDYAVSDLDIVGMYQKTRIINGFEVPAPDTEAPNLGSKYFIASNIHKNFFNTSTWYDYEFDKLCLERGLVFLNKEDAIANTKAMLGINPCD